ncbi:MAG: hypothetical protein WCY16_10160 [Weeksellaceae bacterium]
MGKLNESKKGNQSQTKMKTMRLSTEAIKIVNTMAENENRNFTNMVETLIFRAGQRKQKMIR